MYTVYMWGGKKGVRFLLKDKEKLMFLNRHYLNELAHTIHKGWACRENTGNRRVYVGTKSGVYFLAGKFIIDNELVPLVKIGHTKNISKRRQKGFYTDNPSSLYLIFFHTVFDEKTRKEVEKDYHYKFREHRLRENREWFHLKPVVEGLGLDWEKMNEEQ